MGHFCISCSVLCSLIFETYVTERVEGKKHCKSGVSLEVPVFVSAYGQPEMSSAAVVDWRLESIGDAPEILLQGSLGTLALTPYGVTELAPLMITLPDHKGSVRLWVEVRDSDGTLRARSTLDLRIS